MSSVRYRWRLIGDFVHRFDEHRLQAFSPSDIVYKSTCRRGTDPVGTLSAKDCQCTLLLIGSPRTAAKYKKAHAGCYASPMILFT
jgi:hypothetical protein